MQIVKIFIASSKELEQDRREIELLIARINYSWVEQKEIYLKPVIWEDFLDVMSKTRLQDEYNKEIVKCDIFLMLFQSKVGKFTLEEFKTAVGEFKANNRPFIFTYFKDLAVTQAQSSDELAESLQKFQKLLSKLGHFKSTYKNIDEFKYKFKDQLGKLAANKFEKLSDADARELAKIGVANFTNTFTGFKSGGDITITINQSK